MKMKRQELLKYLLGAFAAALMMTTSSSASMVTGLGVGEFPNKGQVFTVNPWAISPRANRGLANTRQEGQTFKNSSTFEVGQIDISFDVTGGNVAGSVNDTGLKLQIFEVDDVSAATWTPGTLVKELIFADTLPGSTEGLRFTLTGDDKFTLPARFAGTTGYGLVISTPNRLSTDGNPGVIYYTDSGTLFPDPYVDGRFYRDGSGGSLGAPDALRRDAGVVMRVPEPASIGLALLGLVGLCARRRVR